MTVKEAVKEAVGGQPSAFSFKSFVTFVKSFVVKLGLFNHKGHEGVHKGHKDIGVES
jgi:hypothetical protein